MSIDLNTLIENVPSKSVYKSTATNKLKLELHNMIVKSNHKCVLEFGTNTGCSTVILSHACYTVGDSVLYSVDNSSDVLYKAESLHNDYNLRDWVEFVQMDLYDKDDSNWSVLEDLPVSFAFVDAVHDYENVLSDVMNIKRMYGDIDICLHDFGLVKAGVKEVAKEFGIKKLMGEKDNWNPLGGSVDDWEAVLI
mgnify:CR=1 FL=1